MITKICKTCGKEYFIKNSLINTSKYCCKDCQNKSKIKKPPWNKGIESKVEVFCDYCGKPKMVIKSQIEKQKHFFCNTEHRGLYMRGSNNVKWVEDKHTCIDCGKIRDWTKMKRCKVCATKYFRGVNHKNYKNGESLLKREYNYNYKVFREDVLKRDWYTCQECGYKGKKIEVHHIITVKKDKSKMLDVSNGITLCVSCHKKIRAKEEQYEEFYKELLKSKLLT